jgi:hypothetical protein
MIVVVLEFFNAITRAKAIGIIEQRVHSLEEEEVRETEMQRAQSRAHNLLRIDEAQDIVMTCSTN